MNQLEQHLIQEYLHLEKNAQGKACESLVMTILSEDKLFSYDQFLQGKNIIDIKGTPYYDLLEIFAYKTLSEYKENPKLPQLNEKQLKKLRQLTLLSICQSKKSLFFQEINHLLDFKENYAQLEDFLVDCIENELIQARINQKESVVKISYSKTRELSSHQIETLNNKLDLILKQIQNQRQNVSNKIEKLNQSIMINQLQQSQIRDNRQQLLNNLGESYQNM